MKDVIGCTEPDLDPLIGIHFDAGEDVDQALMDAATSLTADGKRVAGVVQTRGQATGDCACREMWLHDLRTGQKTMISEKRGPEARGCHLDWEALTGIVSSMEENLTAENDVLIVNRFGRAECEGRGFRGVIEKAMALGVQVVVAYRSEYAEGWQTFHGGLARDCRLSDVGFPRHVA